MSIILYINGSLMDLEPGTTIAQTKQVNDVSRIENRQSNYTNTFSVPKTAGNVRALQSMTLTGNTSNVPYIKNECSLYSDNGECFVYNGWAVITDGGDGYNIAIVDGIVDFYKAIENQNLSHLGELLDEITHLKTADNILNTWSNDLPYRYILADYNGKTGNTNNTEGLPEVNFDYLVPSVNVAWLWRKIWEKYNNGVIPTGSIFDTFNFKELWMTFPKGLPIPGDGVVNHTILHSEDYSFTNAYLQRDTGRYFYYAKYNSATVDELYQQDGINMHVTQSATYQLVIKCTLYGKTTSFNQDRDAAIAIGFNADGQIPLAAFTSHQLIQNGNKIFGPEADVIPFGTETTLTSVPFQLNGLESISVGVTGSAFNSTYVLYPIYPHKFEVTLVRIDPLYVDFSEAFTDFPVKDFLNEVVQRFGLTMFKDKYSNNYEFLTLQEHLQTSQIVDWTGKFNNKISENYMYGAYAQRNLFKYNYNDKESSHSDGAIIVDNVNLPDTRDVIKSKIYSPERLPVTFLGKDTNVYKLWEKEVNESNEGETISYKILDKRYYFLRSFGVLGGLNLVSDVLGGGSATYSYRESYSRLKFSEIIANYYNPLQRILDKTLLVNAEMWLTDSDITNIDFKKLYYIEQLSNYFILNKISNYVSGKPTKVELLKVKYTDPVLPVLRLTDLSVSNNTIVISFINEYPGTSWLQIWDNLMWNDAAPLPDISPYITGPVLAPGEKIFRLRHENIYSDFAIITV